MSCYEFWTALSHFSHDSHIILFALRPNISLYIEILATRRILINNLSIHQLIGSLIPTRQLLSYLHKLTCTLCYICMSRLLMYV